MPFCFRREEGDPEDAGSLMVGHERSARRKRSGLTYSKVNFGASFDLQEKISVGKIWGRSGCEKLLERDTNRSVIKKSEKCSPDTE